MATKQFSATVDEEIYAQFEQIRESKGLKRSNAVEEALRMYLKVHDEALMAEGARASRNEDLAIAKAARKKSSEAIGRNI